MQLLAMSLMVDLLPKYPTMFSAYPEVFPSIDCMEKIISGLCIPLYSLKSSS